ncbi:hypothetical protein [Sinimarinibacterium sp. NLF-5-8]|uniref:hypothetical protein n=1 Tax=Sinimarinibacterium sp. NLF-5-8 TaxID=2698684 RepID=UPI00137BFCF0|nr:hypothetical protein [Sinimarinibacterium sp. NLF-5-8]QHS09059.1 hypothetical protein GT972_02125 [Sinimarinibacterium sp. NLF-5-8]
MNIQNAFYAKAIATPLFWEDSTFNDMEDDPAGSAFPLPRKGAAFMILIRLHDGKIMGWPLGMTARLHYKVCDEGEYFLLDERMNTLAQWDGAYVPETIFDPDDCGYGDYVSLDIDDSGFVERWRHPQLNRDDWKPCQPCE